MKLFLFHLNFLLIFLPLDELLGLANGVLDEARLTLWIAFDRLDVAFAETPDLERNALRALFRAYNDLKGRISSIPQEIFCNHPSEGVREKQGSRLVSSRPLSHPGTDRGGRQSPTRRSRI